MNFWGATAGYILRFRLYILIFIGAVTVLMAWKATKVEMTYSMPQILPADDPDAIAFAEFRRLFGEDGNLMVIGFETEDVFDKDILNAWFEAAREVKKIEGVKNVFSLADAYNIYRNDSLEKFDLAPVFNHTLLSDTDALKLKDELLSLPFYEGLLFSTQLDGKKATLMGLTLDHDMMNRKDRKQLVDAIEAVVRPFGERFNIRLYYSGLPYIRAINSIKIKAEITIFTLLSLLVTALVLFLFFRSLKAIAFPMVVVALSVVWCVGTLVLLGYKITILTGLIPPLIVIIGIPNCIFLTNQYHREFIGHGNKIKAIARVVKRIGNATFLTNFNTALGFVTFAFTQSSVLSEFGVLSSINVMQVFFLSITILPIVYSYNRSPQKKQTKHLDNRFLVTVIEKLIHIVVGYRPWIYGITVLLIVISAFGIVRIPTTGNFTDDIPRSDRLMQDLAFFESRFKGVMPFEISIDTKKKNSALKLNNLRKTEALQEVLKDFEVFSKPLSVVDVIKFSRQAFYSGDSAFYALPTNEDAAFLLKYAQNSGLGQYKLTTSFVDSNKQVIRVNAQMADIGTTEMQKIKDAIQPRIDSIFPPDKYQVSLTGSSIVFLKGTDYLVENLLTSLIAAIFLISGLMYFMFYSFKMLLVSVIPNIIPLMFTAALMGYWGIALKSSTILVFNIAYGITVDSAIHFFSQYGHELKKHRNDIRAAVLATMRDTNVSIIYTSVILFLGFCIFLYSKFGGTIALGFLVSFTILTGLFTNLLLLPSLLLSIDRAFKIKSYKEPLIMILNEEEDIDLDSLRIRRKDESQDDSEEKSD